MKLFLILLMACIFPLHSYGKTFVIDEKIIRSQFSFKEYASYLPINDENNNIDKVSNPNKKWQKTFSKAQFKPGLWVKINVLNKSKISKWHITVPRFNAKLYVKQRNHYQEIPLLLSSMVDGNNLHITSGIQRFFLGDGDNLLLPQGQVTTLYLRFDHIKEAPMLLFKRSKVEVQKASVYAYSVKVTARIESLVTGAMLFYAIYLLILFYSTKEKNYLILGGYCLGISIFLMMANKIIFIIVPYFPIDMSIYMIVTTVSYELATMFLFYFLYSIVSEGKGGKIVRWLRYSSIVLIIYYMTRLIGFITVFTIYANEGRGYLDFFFPYSSIVDRSLMLSILITFIVLCFLTDKRKLILFGLKYLPYLIAAVLNFGMMSPWAAKNFYYFLQPYTPYVELLIYVCLFYFIISMSFDIGNRIKEKELALRKSYERFVPKGLLQTFNKESIEEVKLGDHVEKEMTILMADIRNYTTIVESMSVEQSYQFLNKYLGEISPVIEKNHGFIDKYIGDAIMGIFPTSADDSIHAAVDMQRLVSSMNNKSKHKITIGVGLNTGNVSIGTLGEPNRMDGSVISDAVNISARVEGLTKQYGVGILITSDTVEKLVNPKQFHLRFIDRVMMKGKVKSTQLYEVLDIYDEQVFEEKLSHQDVFMKAFSIYEKGDFNKALPLFKEAKKQWPDENYLDVFIRRCETFKQNPPDNDWKGVFQFDVK